ncbi:ATP-binding protein [Pelomicrobium sp. G1]|uniref:ATP-binding protein n=1 Tax=unclassified Pelomicrobium TaxID=2815318 RepID=UPI003F760A28
MMSLHRRVALSAALVLAAFVTLTSVALEQAFRESAESARRERLLAQIYLLLGAAEEDAEGRLILPEPLPEPRLSLPGSGLYAQVADAGGAVLWRSPSALGLDVPFASGLPPGARRFERRTDAAGEDYVVQSLGVRWAIGANPRDLTFSVAEDLTEYLQQIRRYRTALGGWLAALSVLLLAVLWLVLRWGLKPLRRVAAEVAAVQAGRQEHLRGEYPEELKLLTENINALLTHERAQQKKLKNALADLAHSLKTPLAVLRSMSDPDGSAPPSPAALGEQLDRMGRLVEYHLQRAAAGRAATFSGPVAVRPMAERLIATLAKVHRDKPVGTTVAVEAQEVFRGAEDDLMEVLGNLLDNAYKWCRSQVRVAAARSEEGLSLTVEDDGPGIEPGEAQRLLERGVRADETVPGHGIGLAVVRDVASAYDGAVAIDRSPLGGARVTVRFRD